MLHVLKETLGKLQLPRRTEKKLLTAADLGCSCGQNTLLVADLIVQGMADELYGGSRLGHPPPEFCFYFNDLPSNDFNTLFHLLPDSARNGGRPAYFAAGVAGSFYDRLFPERFIDVFSSTFSLHWLSQVPTEVMDENSKAYNRGKVFVHGASEATGAAYRRQFQSDLARFLRCRATELERGGAMFLVCLGRPSSAAAPVDQGTVRFLFGDMFQDSWHDLVREGLIDSDKVDSFNVPVYAPTLEEFREVVDADGSFRINRLELVMGSPPVVDHPGDASDVGRTVANNERSLLGALVDAHVGKALCDELFDKLRCRAEERAKELMEEMRFPHVVCSLSLV
ncbi:hypothetical protein HU200_057922 [Digitaria exilis]|uniref:Uncharacterized protein n=1 Tax=Digitaria exilis TaxID=1010633 RepID=A0A835AAR4_9POAL|nr:hypothetical protein HU200_057922 [Digitaria exilis]CAB3486084.1 unnamed protein product [Digitaria exilis]